MNQNFQAHKSQAGFYTRIAVLGVAAALLVLAGCGTVTRDEQKPAQASMAQAQTDPRAAMPDCDMPDTNCQNQNY